MSPTAVAVAAARRARIRSAQDGVGRTWVRTAGDDAAGRAR
ncbi:hypothetical protein [Microbispora hainanensis]|uniref:Uncharacterized protein n=1 Tax=Microbispora hainanensis TaxID=568844 RepID=A0ABZ1SXL7_9ACTN|nr:hypothetical protein [Microbispora hainanensis]